MYTQGDVERGSEMQINPLSTRYRINGFRSLSEFSIDLNPGLNILVGTNGSGKTNFIQCLDFIDAILKYGAETAVSMMGGVARVFSTEQSRRREWIVSINVSSIAELNSDLYAIKYDEPRYFYYEYAIDIRFNRSQAAIYIANESILFRKVSIQQALAPSQRRVGAISVRRTLGEERQSVPQIQIGNRLYSSREENPMSVMRRSLSPGATRGPIRSRGPKDVLEAIDLPALGIDESIFSLRSPIVAIEAVRRSILRGRSFNINPSKARAPDDIARGPGISFDGDGLHATLFYLQKAAASGNDGVSSVRFRRFKPETFENVMNFTRLVFPQLKSINVSRDPHTGKYLATISLNSPTEAKFPLGALSDGTIKWLALVCLLTTGSVAYSLEEPENFLHPQMQQQMVQIVRDLIDDEDGMRYFIISTHSETILNQCRPEEIVMFKFIDGRTECSRLEDVENLTSELQNSGFGLGYYYVSNTL